MVLMQSNYKKLNKGDKAPSFNLKGTDGNDYNLTYLRGKKATLVIFICNHCPYVIPKISEIDRIAKEFQKQLTVIAINSNNHPDYPEDSFENMKKFTDEKRFRFYYLFDETQEIAKAYGAVCTPDSYLFDKDLKLVYHGRIDPDHMKNTKNPELYNIIDKLDRKSVV